MLGDKWPVPLGQSFLYGFRETRKHMKVLLPLSALFFLPEALKALGWGGPGQAVFSEIYKLGAFFILLWMAIGLTKEKNGPQDSAIQQAEAGVEYLKGNALKWSAMALSTALGLSALFLYYLATASPALAFFNFSGLLNFFHGLMDYMLWLKGRPWPELALSVALLGWLPYRVFVMFNFFGYIIVDEGLNAVESLKRARLISQDSFWGLSAFYASCGLAHLLGFSMYVVGAVFTFPITVLATVYVYRSLARAHKAAAGGA